MLLEINKIRISLWLICFIEIFSFVFSQNRLGDNRYQSCNDGVKNCTVNPDQFLNTAQLIARYGYPSESHTIQTEDGYLITLFRIPGDRNGKRGGQPIFLQHGLFSCSSDWVTESHNSLGFILADLGYDVWLGNARGNIYSTGHATLDIHSTQFWNFSFHEVGYYDLPAALYFVSNVTNKPGEIIYIGHSMGTTSFFVFAATRPQAAKNVKLMVAFAPVAYMTHIRSPIRYLAPFSKDFDWLRKHLGINEFLPDSKLMKFLAFDCQLLHVSKEICKDILFAIAGFDKQEFNETLLPVILGHDPAGTSSKTLIHYAQEIDDVGNFQYFDYGPSGNVIKYNQTNPPLYNLKNIKRPIYLMYADNDWLASPIDVERFALNVTSVVGKYKIPLEVFNHVDFLFGKDAVKLVYNPLINFLKNYTEEYYNNYNFVEEDIVISML